MMAEYILREAAREELLSWARCINHPEHLMTADAMCVLDNIPAAEVELVVHGRWVLLRQGGCTSLYACSACQRKITLSGDLNTREPRLKKLYPYCHCGARMDGGGRNDDPVDGQAAGGRRGTVSGVRGEPV